MTDGTINLEQAARNKLEMPNQTEKTKIKNVNVGDVITLSEFGTPKFRVIKIEEGHKIFGFINARFIVVDLGNGNLLGKKLGLKKPVKRALG